MTERYKYSNDGYLNENFRLFHLKDSSGQEKDFHFHEFDKIVILISGKVDYTVEGTTYKLEPWDILLVRHHMIHKAAIDLSVPYERIIIYLDSAYVERFAPNAGLMDCFAEAERRGYCLMRPDENAIAGLKDALGRLEATQDDELFARNPGTAMYRETIYERVWGGDYICGSKTVDIHVQRMRKKVGWEHKLVAVNKVGYRLEV